MFYQRACLFDGPFYMEVTSLLNLRKRNKLVNPPNMFAPKKILTSLVFSIIVSISFGQMTERQVRNFVSDASIADLIEKNNRFFIDGEIFFADIVTTRLVELQPDNPNFNYRKGYSILELNKDYKTAIPHFQKALLDVNNNFDMFSPKEKSAPADVYLHLGTCYHLDENIDKAEEYYQKFIDQSRRKSELLDKANLCLKQCAVARACMNNPVNVKLANVGSEINTSAAEYSPVVSIDGSAIYFTSRRHWSDGELDNIRETKYNQHGEDIYVSYRDFEMNWTEPERLSFCKPQRNEATVAVSTDERRVHLYIDSTSNGDLYFADFYHAQFNDIEPIDVDGVNSEYWETHCMMNHNHSRLYFVSNRLQGYGGRDIYYCEIHEDGSWGFPQNMGPTINTANDEDSPFISIDDKTLYYSTNGERSMGGFDIVKSVLQEDGSWSESENMGYPFNSTNDDIYYTTTIDGLLGYMTSWRKGGKGEKDIYEIQNDYLGVQDVAVLKGKISTYNDEMLPEDVALKIQVVCPDCNKNNSRVIYPRLRDGFFLSSLEPCKTYKVNYTDLKKVNVMYTDSFTTSCDTSFQEIYREFMLNEDGTLSLIQPIAVVEPIDSKVVVQIPDSIVTPIKKFEDFGFKKLLGFNENKLSPYAGELKDFLDKVEKQIEGGRKHVTINIYSSASTVPTSSFSSNEALAQKRSENVEKLIADYIKKKQYKDKISFLIVESLVQGPAYEDDFENKERYGPYQYVRLETK